MGFLEIIITTVVLIVVTAITQSRKNTKAQRKIQAPINVDDTDSTLSDTIDTSNPTTSSNTLITKSTPLHIDNTKAKPKVAHRAAAQGAKASQSPKNTQKTASDCEDDTTFDLRKAVIYSEILTPKFKEEDF